MSDVSPKELQELLAKLEQNPDDRETAERVSDLLLPDLTVIVTQQGLDNIFQNLLRQGTHPEAILVSLATILMKSYQEHFSEGLTDQKIGYWIANIQKFSQKYLSFISEYVQKFIDRADKNMEIPQEFYENARTWKKLIEDTEEQSKNQTVEDKIELTTIVLHTLDQFMTSTQELEMFPGKEVFVNSYAFTWLKLTFWGYAEDPTLFYFIDQYWKNLYPFVINDFMLSLWQDED